MIDSVIAGTGNSRYLRTSLSASTTWAEALTMLRAGAFPIDLAGINQAGFTTVGTALNSANLLKSAVITALGLSSDATPSDAWEAVLDLIGGKQATIGTTSVTLASSSWSGSGPYTQAVSVSGYTVTANTMADVSCDNATLTSLMDMGVSALYVQNNSGTLTAYCHGALPTESITLTLTVYDQTPIS